MKQSQYTHFQWGVYDAFSLSYGDYGWKSGIWRLFDLLNERGITATMSVNGLAAERHPGAVQTAIQMGVEVAGHNWANDIRMSDEDPEGELAEIRKCTSVLTEVAGVRPVGWVSVGLTGTTNTNRFLAQEGYIWNADDASEDVPFKRRTESGELVVFPRAGLPMNDLSMWALAKNSPSVIWDNFKDTFDTLYAESSRDNGRIIDITLHAHMAGRPTLIPTVRRMISYAQEHEGVLFATRRQVAEWVLAEKDEGAAAAAG